MRNLLNHLICNEVGTSAFLGTLLDPQFDDVAFVHARTAVAQLLKRHGIEFSSPSPNAVQLEYLNIDLVAVWSPWVLLIENKVASASVTRGQLKDYYAACLLQFARNGFLSDVVAANSLGPICFIYLTPTPYTGMAEFNTLELLPERGDKKIHIGWNELLDCITPIVDSSTSMDFWFLRAGTDRVREVILAAKAAGLPEDERRVRLQALLNDLRDQVQRSGDFARLVIQRWSDQAREQLFAAGPARTAYVGLYLSYNGTAFPSTASIKAVGDMSFDVASKHRPRLRAIVTAKSSREWADLLGVSIGDLHLDLEKGSICWRFSLPEMAVESFVRLAKERLAVFSSVFGSVLLEATEGGAAQSAVAAEAPQPARR